MKTTLIKLLALSGIAVLLLPACKKTDTLVTSNGGTPGALTVNPTSLVLDKTKVNDATTQVVTFSFSNASYNFSAAVTNTLQIDIPSDNWKNPVSATLATGVTKQSYNTPDFNNMLLKLGIPGNVSGTINIRVSQAVSGNLAPIYSNVVTMTVTPFFLTSWIYTVGAFQGWNINNVDSLVSVTGNGIYTGVINFPAGANNNQFLIVPAKNYNHKYATSQTSTPTTQITYDAGNNILGPATAGQYLVTFNSAMGTITFQLADTYSVIGDAALGWNATGNDSEMKYINDAVGTWTVTLPLVSSGSFKVRQDDAWSNSWGVPKSGSEGFGVANTLNSTTNDNLTVAANGTYKVNFVAPATVQGAKALVTTTYSVAKTN